LVSAIQISKFIFNFIYLLDLFANRYRLGDAETPDESSDDDDNDDKDMTFTPGKKTPAVTATKNTPGKGATPVSKVEKKSPAKKSSAVSDDDDEDGGGDGDGATYGGDTDSADDTDEEIRRSEVKIKFYQICVADLYL
jgi:hypothetical protein